MKKEKLCMGDESWSLPMDPNLPRWDCQNCCHSLCVVGVNSYNDKFFNNYSCSGMHGSSIHGVNSVIGSTRMDNSFVVLPQQKPQQQPQGIPPCPHAGAGAVQLDISLPRRQCKNHLWVTIS